MTTQDEYQNVCENIRFLRQTYGLSRTAMAHRLHITVKTLDSLEMGIFPERIHIGFLFHVHKAFGIQPKRLLMTRLAEGKAP